MSDSADQLQTTLPRPKRRQHLTRAGLGLTAIYILLCASLILHGDVIISSLKANEIGDFLAGIFAPLALLWLILGFFQQGQELRHSADALWLQGEELRNSVEQQRELVAVTREQVTAEMEALRAAEAEAERRAQPILIPSSSPSYDGERCKFVFLIHNGGPACSNARVLTDGKIRARVMHLPEGEALKFARGFQHHAEVAGFRGFVVYHDNRGNLRAREFNVERLDNQGPNDRHTLSAPMFSSSVLMAPFDFEFEG